MCVIVPYGVRCKQNKTSEVQLKFWYELLFQDQIRLFTIQKSYKQNIIEKFDILSWNQAFNILTDDVIKQTEENQICRHAKQHP